MGIPVVGVGDTAETLLSCRVPDLPRSRSGESVEGNAPGWGCPCGSQPTHAQSRGFFSAARLGIAHPLPKLTCNFTFTPSTATTLFCRREGEHVYHPKAHLGMGASSPGVEPAVPRPLSCSPQAGRMKPGCLWGWSLKPHCYKPWSCWGAAMPRSTYRDIPEQHPLVPGWKRAESGPDGDRRARSQPALDPVPRSSPTASAPVLWLPSPLTSWLMMQAALQSPGTLTCSSSHRAAPSLQQPLPTRAREVRQSWRSGEGLA